ncbi:uncharacterized protein GGS25DRAFT_523509 [Hypoxylon fragiforme]|uniref:uncharacterized protein n=1 Tax=Hypoxylon fragiforme TaxID=63214 RepID=UPI0020C742ED|nr:uncharacterized protein GGS25DRAFT_523509 [Hypoxylon fragiforme]KAI2605835.1 hypothetical protein GGS25DRAFT_523509 [Hypoxylon fragiforme]
MGGIRKLMTNSEWCPRGRRGTIQAGNFFPSRPSRPWGWEPGRRYVDYGWRCRDTTDQFIIGPTSQEIPSASLNKQYETASSVIHLDLEAVGIPQPTSTTTKRSGICNTLNVPASKGGLPLVPIMVPPQLRGGWSLHSLDGVLSENPESDGANQNRGIRHGNQTQPEPKNSPPMLFWINFQYKSCLLTDLTTFLPFDPPCRRASGPATRGFEWEILISHGSVLAWPENYHVAGGGRPLELEARLKQRVDTELRVVELLGNKVSKYWEKLHCPQLLGRDLLPSTDPRRRGLQHKKTTYSRLGVGELQYNKHSNPWIASATSASHDVSYTDSSMTACLKPAEGKTHFPVPRHLLNLHAGSLQRGVNIQPSLLPLFQSFTTEQQLGADEHGAITNVGSVLRDTRRLGKIVPSPTTAGSRQFHPFSAWLAWPDNGWKQMQTLPSLCESQAHRDLEARVGRRLPFALFIVRPIVEVDDDGAGRGRRKEMPREMGGGGGAFPDTILMPLRYEGPYGSRFLLSPAQANPHERLSMFSPLPNCQQFDRDERTDRAMAQRPGIYGRGSLQHTQTDPRHGALDGRSLVFSSSPATTKSSTYTTKESEQSQAGLQCMVGGRADEARALRSVEV